jgi:hypothetical protein
LDPTPAIVKPQSYQRSLTGGHPSFRDETSKSIRA